MPYLRVHRTQYLLIFLAMFLVAVTGALSAYIFKHILNDIFIAKDEKMLLIIPMVVVLIFLVRGIARFASSYLSSRIGIRVANGLRSRLYAHLLRAEYVEVQRFTTGDLNALMVQTLLNIQNAISKTIPQMLISLMTIVALVVVILYSDWRLALYAIAVGLLIIIPVSILGKGVKRHTADSEIRIREISNQINEDMHGLDLIKVYGAEAYKIGSFSRSTDAYENHQIEMFRYQLLTSPFMEFFLALAIALVIYLGGGFVIEGSMTAGDFFAFMVALMMLYAPIKNLTQNSMALYALKGYTERVEQILSLPLEAADKRSHRTDTLYPVVFAHMHYQIEKKEILKDITLEIAEGDRIAIVGKSGAGKSTLIALLFGLGGTYTGRITVGGAALSGLNFSFLRQKIAYVNQQAAVFNSTIRENILYGLPMERERYKSALAQAQCGFIETLPDGDEGVAGEFGSRLSGGQRQRIALARAIYRGGELFVLDEATSALDSHTEEKIQQSIEVIMKKTTSIIIAHRLTTIERCNKVVVMEEGRIVEQGSYEEVSQTEAFRKNFGVEGGDG